MTLNQSAAAVVAGCFFINIVAKHVERYHVGSHRLGIA